MTRTEIGHIGGKPIHFCQCENKEEAAKYKLEAGLYFFWEHAGRVIKSPGEVTNLFITEAQSGKLDVAKYAQPEFVAKHYQGLRDNVHKQVQQTLTDLQTYYANTPGISKEQLEAVTKHIDQSKQVFSNIGFPDKDGIYRPTEKQAEAAIGAESVAQIDPISRERLGWGNA